ncbi:MAG: PadR family transcriptional regulator [bacterium]
MALREAILGLLCDAPMTGYEIKQFFRNVIKNFWSVSDGQLYPTLKKMHAEDLITLKVVRQDSTANKHVYSISDKGRAQFEKWLRAPVTKFEELKEPFVLKVFFFHKLGHEEILWHLRSQVDLHSRILDEFRSIRDAYDARITPYQRLIGDMGLLYVEVRMLWLNRMIELLRKGLIEQKGALYTEEMVEIGKRFLEEIFAESPSREFRNWLEKVRSTLPPPVADRKGPARKRDRAAAERLSRGRLGVS